MKVLVHPDNNKVLLMTEDDDTKPVGVVFVAIKQVFSVAVSNIPKFEVAAENTRQNQFIVKILLEGRTIEIPLGSKNTEGTNNQVINQPTWTNTAAGADIAVNDILSWIQ